MQIGLDAGNLFPIGRTAEHVGSRAAVDRQGGPAGVFDGLGHVAGVDRVAARAEADLGRHRRRGAGLGHRRHDLAHAVGITQQIRSAVGLFGNFHDRAAEIDVHDADAKLPRQPPADFRHERGIVVPDLRGQRPRFVQDAPQPLGRTIATGIDRQKPRGAEHLRGRQADPAMPPDHLAKGIVRKTGHGSLENRRIDHQTGQFPADEPCGALILTFSCPRSAWARKGSQLHGHGTELATHQQLAIARRGAAIHCVTTRSVVTRPGRTMRKPYSTINAATNFWTSVFAGRVAVAYWDIARLYSVTARRKAEVSRA